MQDYPAGQGFILVYRLAMDARPCGVMVGLTENIQACLGDFQTGTASMARKRHLHQAQGVFYVFVLWPPQEYYNEEPVLRRTALQAEDSH